MKSVFKLLTFITLLTASSQDVCAQLISQNTKKTFLRWNLQAKKDQIKVEKKPGKVVIQSLDSKFFEQLSENIAKINKNQSYHKNFKFVQSDVTGGANRLEIDLSGPEIELFSFYQNETNSYVLDFWVNKDLIRTKEASVVPNKIKLAKPSKQPAKKKVVKKEKKNFSESIKPKVRGKFAFLNPKSVKKEINNTEYRDFRYGAAFIWDYEALVPPLEEDINLNVKGPDFLYQVKDRTYLDDEKEAHMQLNINFYKKEQWGLMTRSINLYEEKYGKDKNHNLNNFMKATSMLKNNIKQTLKPEYLSKMGPDGEILPANEYSKRGVFAAAKNILTNIVDSTQEYAMKKSILRYLIQDARNQEDHIQALNYAKSLYVEASTDYDDDMIIFSSRVILNSLAHLRQLKKMKDFLENKAVKRVLPKQEGLAYVMYVNLARDYTDKVVAAFQKNQGAMTKPIHPAILFNSAEAFFRQGKYEKSITLFDEFIGNYSIFSRSGDARIRIALSYDLLNKDPKKVLRLYKDAINKNPELGSRYEAKLRYVGFRVARKRELSDEDKEVIVFIDGDDGEKKSINPNLRKLLWLVRLRTMINTQKYDDALAYLSSIPIENLRRVEQRTFHADGAEVVLGIIKDSYLKEDYGRTVKVWEVYKDKYEKKVAKNPYMTFIVSDSFIKLGLIKSYKRAMKQLLKIKPNRVRTFPLWVKSHKNIPVKDYILELRVNELLQSNDFKGLAKVLEENKQNKNINYNYYNALVSYNLKNYNESVSSVESLLVTPNINNSLTPKQNQIMLETYLESLYEVADGIRFRKNAAALVNDVRRSTANRYKDIILRAEYLYMESLFSEKDVNYSLLQRKAKEFLAEYEDATYNMRVKYLRGVSLIKSKVIDEGKKILFEMIEDNETPEYLKGLARTELSSLELKNRTL